MLPERIRALEVDIAGVPAAQLLKHSIYEFRYLRADDPDQPAASLLMPPATPTYQDGDLFPAMDQNLPLSACLVAVTIGLWATARLPDYLVALLFFAAVAVLRLAPADILFSGFSSAAFWLC